MRMEKYTKNRVDLLLAFGTIIIHYVPFNSYVDRYILVPTLEYGGSNLVLSVWAYSMA